VALDTLPGHQKPALDQYKNRLNFDPTRPGAGRARDETLNVISLCRGALGACVPTTDPNLTVSNLTDLQACDTEGAWWARVDAARGGAPKYLCATRRGHENMGGKYRIPGTARWRWMASDEGVWDRCGQGCCETLGPGG
jgi:hypothetical protein